MPNTGATTMTRLPDTHRAGPWPPRNPQTPAYCPQPSVHSPLELRVPSSCFMTSTKSTKSLGEMSFMAAAGVAVLVTHRVCQSQRASSCMSTCHITTASRVNRSRRKGTAVPDKKQCNISN